MKDLLRSLLYRLGLLGLAHRLRNRKALTVLMFHRVLPDGDPRLDLAERDFTLSMSSFRRVLDFVERHYHVVKLDDVQRWSEGLGDLPHCPVLLTFDDGWRDTLTHAAPEVQRRHWTAVLFVASEVPELLAPRWWQDALVQAMDEPGVRGRLWAAAGFSGVAPPDSAWRLTAHLAGWAEFKRIAWLDQHAPGVTTAVRDRQMLNANDLAQLEQAGLELAGHGHTHAPLTLVDDPMEELQSSCSLVRQYRPGSPAMSFPHGAWSPFLLKLAQQAGFGLVFNSDPTMTSIASGGGEAFMPLGRIHLPENEWTCHRGQIAAPKLATFLFWRAHAMRSSKQSHRRAIPS